MTPDIKFTGKTLDKVVYNLEEFVNQLLERYGTDRVEILLSEIDSYFGKHGCFK